MAIEYIERTSRTCSVKHSEICKFLGCDGCAKCPLNKQSVKQYEKKRTNEIWEVTKTLLPEDADNMHLSETCLFCKDRPGKEKIGYGLVDIANPEPEEQQKPIFGMGTKIALPVGSLLQIPVTMCKSCKRKFNFVENLKFIGLGIGLLVGLLVIWALSGTDLMQYSDAIMPIMFLVVGLALGYLGGRWFASWWLKKTQNEVHYHIFDIPELASLKEYGWFELNRENEKSRVFFSKKKPRNNFMFFSQEVFEEEELYAKINIEVDIEEKNDSDGANEQ